MSQEKYQLPHDKKTGEKETNAPPVGDSKGQGLASALELFSDLQTKSTKNTISSL